MTTEDMEIKKANVLMIFFEANTFKKEFNRKVLEYRTEKYRRSVYDEYPIPYCITLASFACELFIKFLIGVDTIMGDNEIEVVNIPKGHNLEKLYNKLSRKYQKIILDKIEKKTLEKILERNANSFMEWRYIYECKEEEKIFNYDYIKQFIDVLYEISNKENDNICFGEDKCTKVIMQGTDICRNQKH